MIKKIILIFSILLLLPKTSPAQELHATFVDWNVFSISQGKKKICYIASLPIKKEGNYNKRGEAYFLVTDTIDGNEEISLSSGYNYKKNSEVEISFGLQKFNIFTYNNMAWANNKIEDLEIIKQMRISEDMVISAVAANNVYSRDTYSLVGFIEAYNKMREICK